MLSPEAISLASHLRDEMNSYHYWHNRREEAETARARATTELAKSETRVRGLVADLAQALKEAE